MNNNIKKRIDSLGRIVIPKQIREELKINDFDELIINVEKDYIILKKSLMLSKYKIMLDKLLQILKKAYKFDIIIVTDGIILSSNRSDLTFGDKIVGFSFDKINNQFLELNVNGNKKFSSFVRVDDLIVNSNLMGYMIILDNESLCSYNDDIILIKSLIIDLI